jgi:hypothetical protein
VLPWSLNANLDAGNDHFVPDDLRTLSRTRLRDDDGDAVVLDRLDNLLPPTADGKRGINGICFHILTGEHFSLFKFDLSSGVHFSNKGS